MADSVAVAQYSVAFCLSVLMAYIDISTFFQQIAKFRISPFVHLPCVLFLIFNGVLAVLLMYIALDNHWITENQWAMMFLSGLGTAGLLRSKLFTFGEKNIEFGFEYIYNFLKNQTIAKLADASGLAKIQLSIQLAEKYLHVAEVLGKFDKIAGEIAKSPSWDTDKQTKFQAEYDGIKNDPNYNPLEDKLAALIRVFIDYSDLKYTRKLIQTFLEK